MGLAHKKPWYWSAPTLDMARTLRLEGAMAIIRDRTLAELTSGQYDLNFPSVGIPTDSSEILVFYVGDGHRTLGAPGTPTVPSLSGLSDTDIDSPEEGQFLVRGESAWINASFNLMAFSPEVEREPGQILTLDGDLNPFWSNPFIGSFSLDSLTDVDMTGFNSGVQNVLVNTPGSSILIPSSLAALTAKSFLNLTDTPNSYGSAGQIVAINGTGDGLVFVAPSAGATTLLQLNDTPGAYGAPGQALVVNPLGDGTIWASIAGSGATTFLGLSDTPNAFTGAGKKLLAVNQAANAVEFITNSIMNHVDMASDTPEQDDGIVYDANALGVGVPGFKLQEMLRVNLSNDPYAAGRVLLSNGSDFVDTQVTLLQPGITTGDLWYYDSVLGTPVRLAAGTSGHVLKGNGPGVAPSFADPSGLISVPTFVPTTGAGVVSSAGLLPQAITSFPQAIMRGGGWSLSEIPPFQGSIYYQGQARVLMENAIWSRSVPGIATATWDNTEKANWIRLVALATGSIEWPTGNVSLSATHQAYTHFVQMSGTGQDQVTVPAISGLNIGSEVEIYNAGPTVGTFVPSGGASVVGSTTLEVGKVSRFKVKNSTTWVRMQTT